jgi:hypothetical protein
MGSRERSVCADREEFTGLHGVPARHPRRWPPDDGGLEGISCDEDNGDADLLMVEGIFVRGGTCPQGMSNQIYYGEKLQSLVSEL